MELILSENRSIEHIKTSIGGQALIEGIMMRGPKKVAMAVRRIDSGEMIVKDWENSAGKAPKILKLPIIRGVYNFIFSMKLGYKCLMDSAELSGMDELEENEKKGKKTRSSPETSEISLASESPNDGGSNTDDTNDAEPQASQTDTNAHANTRPAGTEKKSGGALWNLLMAAASVLGVVLSLVLFIYIPSLLFSLLASAVPSLEGRFTRSLFEGVLRIVIFIIYMALVAQLKDIRRTFMYHGAEHKTIFCYEAGLELTVENVRIQRRFHPRCGTSFMILMLIVGIFISMFITVTNPILRTLIKLCLLPITVGVGYELIKFAGRHDNIITKIISAPGVWLQHISVLEPDDGMIECAIEAVKRVIPDDGSDRW